MYRKVRADNWAVMTLHVAKSCFLPPIASASQQEAATEPYGVTLSQTF